MNQLEPFWCCNLQLLMHFSCKLTILTTEAWYVPAFIDVKRITLGFPSAMSQGSKVKLRLVFDGLMKLYCSKDWRVSTAKLSPMKRPASFWYTLGRLTRPKCLFGLLMGVTGSRRYLIP